MRLLLMLAALAAMVVPSHAAPHMPAGAREGCVLITASGGMLGAGATGTGFCIAPGYVVTCEHLTRIPGMFGTKEARGFTVQGRDGRPQRATVVARDPAQDIMLLRIPDPQGLQPLPVAQSSPDRGAAVHIVGNFPDAFRVSPGAVTRTGGASSFAMASAKVRLGYSGGPVFDNKGIVVGMLSQKDARDNAIFVTAQNIRKLFDTYGDQSGAALALAPLPGNEAGDEAEPGEPAAPATAIADAPEPDAQPLPAQRTAPKTTREFASASAPGTIALPAPADPESDGIGKLISAKPFDPSLQPRAASAPPDRKQTASKPAPAPRASKPAPAPAEDDEPVLPAVAASELDYPFPVRTRKTAPDADPEFPMPQRPGQRAAAPASGAIVAAAEPPELVVALPMRRRTP